MRDQPGLSIELIAGRLIVARERLGRDCRHSHPPFAQVYPRLSPRGTMRYHARSSTWRSNQCQYRRTIG